MLFAASLCQAEQLVATRLADGEVLAHFFVPEDGEWCVKWHHSVKGFEVSDCYQNQEGRMVLVWSHLPDFAAGLDHIPGRGRQVSDGQGGYFILDINEPVPNNAYILRPGAGAVDHRLQLAGGDKGDDRQVSLSALAARQRVRISLVEDTE